MTKLMIGKELFDWFYPIGSYYETSDTNFNPTTAGWYGTWVEDTKGETLVSRNSGTFKNVGDVVGEENHQLTIEEMPSHYHEIGRPFFKFAELQYGLFGDVFKGDKWQDATQQTNTVGGNKPHNNIQPSKVCIRWHRTA